MVIRVAIVLAWLAGVAAADGASVRSPPGWTKVDSKPGDFLYRSPTNPRFELIAHERIYPNDQLSLWERGQLTMNGLAKPDASGGLGIASENAHRDSGGGAYFERTYTGGGLTVREIVRAARDDRGDVHVIDATCTDDDHAGCADAIVWADHGVRNTFVGWVLHHVLFDACVIAAVALFYSLIGWRIARRSAA